MKAIIYTRSYKGGIARDMQESICIKYANVICTDISYLIHDDFQNSLDIERDGLFKAVKLLNHCKSDLLIVSNIQVLTHNVQLLNDLIMNLSKCGASVASVLDSFHSSTGAGRLAMSTWEIMSQKAFYYGFICQNLKVGA